MSDTPQPSNNLQPRDVTAARANPQSRWVCGYQRLGLPCATGPDSRGHCGQGSTNGSHERCLPRRAAWFSRQTLTLNLAILTAGLLLLSTTLPQREAIFVPGGLSSAHSQILDNHLVSERCSLCHPGSHADVSTLKIQDDLCLQCHTKHLPQAHLHSPHDLPRGELAKLTQKANPFAKLVSADKSIQTNCASCHVEHRGAGFDLTAISDASCQACHQQSFSSLSQGHPEFDNYPYRSVRNIAFDHAAHEREHFAAKNETFECRRCHIDLQRSGELGPVLRSVSFEQACSSCHTQAIQAATIDGWAMLQLPSLEAADVRDATHELSRWPHDAQFGYEGQIDVPLRLLLAADLQMRESLAVLPASGRLVDIDNENGQRSAVARSLAGGLQRLIGEVAVDGQAALQRRLQITASTQLGRDLTAAEQRLTEAVSQGLPPDLFRQMQSGWFGTTTDSSPVQKSAVHNAPVQNSAVHNAPADAPPARDDGALLVHDGAGDVLADNLLANELLSDELLSDAVQSEKLLGEQTGRADAQLTALRGASHVAAGGWYLDRELLAVRYMPRGHADPTLAAWAEYIALVNSGTSHPHRLTQGIGIPGGCTECHLLHPNRSSLDAVVSWTSSTRSPVGRSFTKFDHRPHLTLPALDDCRYCHQFRDQSSASLASVLAEQLSSGSRGSSPQQLTQAACQFLQHEFIDMRREQCAACHHRSGASDRCTQCHNYHVGFSD